MNYFLFGMGIVLAVLALTAYIRVDQLEKKLKEKGILEEDRDNTKK